MVLFVSQAIPTNYNIYIKPSPVNMLTKIKKPLHVIQEGPWEL